MKTPTNKLSAATLRDIAEVKAVFFPLAQASGGKRANLRDIIDASGLGVAGTGMAVVALLQSDTRFSMTEGCLVLT